MTKNKIFYLSLIIIYILFLSKDTIIGFFNSKDINLCNNESYYQEEYNKLSKILEIEPNQYNIIYSKTILHDIYEFYDSITILKGTNNNIKKGDIVINNKGVIGIVNKVYKNYSKVSLLTNKDINLSVKINNSYGILTSKDNKIIIKNIKLNNEININDLVYTSGLTEVKEGLLIGEVTSITKDPLDLEYLIEVKPSVDFYNLNYVGVVL